MKEYDAPIRYILFEWQTSPNEQQDMIPNKIHINEQKENDGCESYFVWFLVNL